METALSNKSSSRVRKRVLSDEIVDRLTDAIMRGDFPPGSKIAELQAAKMFSVSQSTIREAFRELESMGFLESKPYQGTFVREFSILGLKDYFKTRTELEVLAAKWAVERETRYTPQNDMLNLLKEMGYFVFLENHVAFRKKDMEFHRILVKSSGSKCLLSAWNSLAHSYWAYFGLFFEQQRYNLKDQMEKHHTIYNILKDGRLEELKGAIEDHYVDISFIHQLQD